MKNIRSLFLAASLAALAIPGSDARAQTMPGEVYHSLASEGHEDFARHIQRKLERREDAGDRHILLYET